MSLATNIKEFADLLHNIYAEQLSSLEGTDILSDGVLPLAIPKAVVLQQACLYGLKSFGSAVLSFLSLEWLRDFSYFPLISPENQNEASLAHDTFLSEPFSYLFSFAKNGVTLSQSKPSLAIENSAYNKAGSLSFFNGFLKGEFLLAGVVNSLFFSFPFSLPYLITLRRMFSQGAAAAAASIFGTVSAHTLIIVGVVYGIRFLIIPYYSFQPAIFLIGSFTIAIIIAEFLKEKRVYLVPLTHYPSLFRIGVLNFVLALCESATVFHDLHHFTLYQQATYVKLDSSQSALENFFLHTAYVITFVLGHLLFSLLFCYLLLRATEKVCSLTGWTVPQTARRITRGLLVAILTLTFSSFPYYGLDYLFTKSAGFLPEDPAYRNTIFSPTQVLSRNRHFKSRAPATKDSKTPLELDLSYFDRAMYLGAPKEEKPTRDLDKAENTAPSETVATYDPVLTFEELNYQGESAWLMRHERARRLPEEDPSKKDSVFQKPKTHFKELRLKQDNKQAEAALKESSQIGSISSWKEGSIPGERLRPYDENFSSDRWNKIDRSSLPVPDSRSALQIKNLYENPALQEAKTSKELTNQGFIQVAPPRESDRGDGQSFADKSKILTQEIPKNPSYEKERDERALLKELAFEKAIASSYEKSFASPFGEESDGTPPDLLPVENIIKKRYRLNPVYRALLQTDIDSFLARQPADYKITQNQEASLFKKRQLLEKYYNSVRYYSPVESVGFTKRHFTGSSDARSRSIDREPRESAKLGILPFRESKAKPAFTKSFSETIYHQQFKGTLNTIKRFFRLSLDTQQNPNRARILSYDQALYKKRNALLPLQKEKVEGLQKSRALQSRALYEDLEGESFDRKDHPSLHEELNREKVSPFIEESNSAPIYAGWDEKERRFVITNRFSFLTFAE